MITPILIGGQPLRMSEQGRHLLIYVSHKADVLATGQRCQRHWRTFKRKKKRLSRDKTVAEWMWWARTEVADDVFQLVVRHDALAAYEAFRKQRRPSGLTPQR